MAMLYTLPDGSDDTPDDHGRHTATVNVLHSAAQFGRFPGCEHCRGCADSDAHGQHTVTRCAGWDAQAGQFASVTTEVTFTPGCPVCERDATATP